MMKRSLITTLCLGALLLGFLIYKKMNTVKFMILHTNDHHGRFMKDRKGRYGMAARATLIKEFRAKAKKSGKEFLLLSAGDINTGSFESDLLQAEPDFKAMEMMGYDAMAVGNHEFDHPLEIVRKQQTWVSFPFLSANIFFKGSNEKVFEPYKIFQKSGLTIGVLGLTTETTPERKDEKRAIEFAEPVGIVEDIMPDLQKRTDFIIGLTHLGCYHDNPDLVNKTGDIHLLKNTQGIDMIIGGHSQIALDKPVFVGKKPIVQAKEYGEYIGKIEFEFFAGKVRKFEYKLIKVENTVEDSELVNLFKPYLDQARSLGQRVIAKSDSFFIGKDREIVRRKEVALGNLIGAAYRAKTNSDIAIIGGGALRNDLPKGNISFKNVKEILPFGNTLTKTILTGLELKAYLAPIVKLANGQKNGAFPQMSGIQVFVDNEYIIRKISVAGNDVLDQKKYSIVMDSYLATREKQYPDLSKYSSFSNTGYVDYLSFIEYIQDLKVIKKKDYLPTGDIIIEK